MDYINDDMTKEEIIKEELDNIVASDEVEGNDDDELNITTDNRRLTIEKVDITIDSLERKYSRQKLILQPDYQRKFVMKPQIASRLIESILLNIPLPVVYFAEEEDSSWSVIDGQQRLTSIISFVKGKFLYDNKDFKLTGLNVMTELNRKKFDDLDEALQEKIYNTPINSFVIKNDSNEDVKFEIFERLNTGSTPLNEDEIRNTIYRGSYMDLLKELENDSLFDKLVSKPNFKNRMLYRGMILRFFAFNESSYLKYKPSMKQFCNKHLKKFRNADEDYIKEARVVFKETISKIYSVFGENAFRRLVRKGSDNNSDWIKTRINMALFDIQMFGFTLYSKEQIIRNADAIREAMIDLMTTNIEFVDSIEMRTSSTEMVNRRFKLWLNELDKIIGNPNVSEQRCYDYSLKKKLFEENPTCSLCGQQILNIDDAHVDHIKAFANGGETTKENAQLAHRYCNQHKSNN